MRRRRFIALAGTALSCSIAGCSRLLPDGPSTPSRSATAAVIESKVVAVQATSGHSKYYVLTGRVKNTGEGRLHDPGIIVKFYTKNGSVLRSTTQSIHSLKQGQIWELCEGYFDPGTAPVKGTIELTHIEAGLRHYTHPPELTVANVRFVTDYATSGSVIGDMLVGDITNTTDKALDVFVTGQFLDTQKHIIGANSDSLSGIDPGDTVTFHTYCSLITPEIDSRPTDYELYLRTKSS